jgi:predicted N-acetyltransferase YhbS
LGRGKGLKIDWVHVQPEHGTKKVGVSLAAAAYKHLHKRGHSIKSDTKQSIGGANLWNSLRHDPETKHHTMFHDERNNKPIAAHKVPEGEIWHDEPHAQETTLVLHAKPKKKTVKEDIELIPVHRDQYVDKRKAADVHKAYGSKTYSSDKVVKRKNLGQIHPGYDLHQHSVEINTGRGSERAVKHRFTIVHRASGDVAGEMHAWGGKLHPIKGVVRGTKGKGLKVSYLEVHPDHREKKIGASLPVEMYRHLHRRGHAIQSDAIQSHGAAHVWNTMRHDRELKKHMMIHDNATPVRGQVHSFEKRAYRRPEKHIWYQHGRNWSDGREKVEASHGDEPETVKTLILSGKKRKKKTVKEDIEMAQILNKPHGGYHRDFAKMVAAKGMTPKRSGRIAKGYSLHTSKDKDDPKIENHHIVHDATGHVAGEVTTVTHGKDHTVVHTDIHGDHTKKKIGKSLAVLAYKHLARKKGNLWSSGLQSPGGASIWNRLRKDPKMRGRVFHSSTSGEVPAHDLPDKKIWASDLPVTKSKGTPEHLPAPRYSYHGATKEDKKEHSRVLRSRLVIRHPKKS